MLNVFDGVILHFVVLVSVLPLVEFFNDYNTTFVELMTFTLVILPLFIFIIMSVMLNRKEIKKLPGYCYTKCSQLHLRSYNQIPLNEVEESSDEDEYVNFIDDSTRSRVNMTVCDV